MTRFSRFTIMSITLLASLAAAACQSDERSPTAPVVAPSAAGAATRGIAPVVGGTTSPSLSWYGADGHQYSVVMVGDESRHFQDGVEYGEISGTEAVYLDSGAIIDEQLLGTAGAGPMAVRGGGQLEDDRTPAHPQSRPQGQMLAPCSAEIGSYLEASTTMIAAAAYYKMSRTTKARLAFAAAVVSWVNSWRALYACESANLN